MIAALRRAAATTGRLIEAAVNARTLARTVRILARQLDNAHLLAASEEARADRAELRVAELELQLADWRETSGELSAEQPAADALPDLTDAGEAPIPLVLTDSAREADIQRDRADALQRALQACEVDLVTARAQLQQTERAAGAHIATIEALREQIAAAHRAAHAIAPAEQIPGVAAAGLPRVECTVCPYVATGCETTVDPCPACGSKLAEIESCDACGKPVRDAYRTGEAEAVLLCWDCTRKAEREEAAVMRRSAEIDAAADDPPPTRPSERTATRTT